MLTCVTCKQSLSMENFSKRQQSSAKPVCGSCTKAFAKQTKPLVRKVKAEKTRRQEFLQCGVCGTKCLPGDGVARHLHGDRHIKTINEILNGQRGAWATGIDNKFW